MNSGGELAGTGAGSSGSCGAFGVTRGGSGAGVGLAGATRRLGTVRRRCVRAGLGRRRPVFERRDRGRALRAARVGLFKGLARSPCAGIARAGGRLGASGTASCGPRAERNATTAPTTTAARTRRATPGTHLRHAVARVAHAPSSWSVSRLAPSLAAWSKTPCAGWRPRVDVVAGSAKMFRRGSATAPALMSSSGLSMASAHKEALHAKLAPHWATSEPREAGASTSWTCGHDQVAIPFELSSSSAQPAGAGLRAVASRWMRQRNACRRGLLLIVPSERLAGTAGDARIRGRARAESRKGIPLRSVAPSLPTRTRTRVGVMGGAHGSRGRPTGIALAALSLALAQPTAPDLWFSPGPKILERSA